MKPLNRRVLTPCTGKRGMGIRYESDLNLHYAFPKYQTYINFKNFHFYVSDVYLSPCNHVIKMK